MKDNLIYCGMLLSIMGMIGFDDIASLKYSFLIGAIILIVLGLRMNSEKTKKNKL